MWQAEFMRSQRGRSVSPARARSPARVHDISIHAGTGEYGQLPLALAHESEPAHMNFGQTRRASGGFVPARARALPTRPKAQQARLAEAAARAPRVDGEPRGPAPAPAPAAPRSRAIRLSSPPGRRPPPLVTAGADSFASFEEISPLTPATRCLLTQDQGPFRVLHPVTTRPPRVRGDAAVP